MFCEHDRYRRPLSRFDDDDHVSATIGAEYPRTNADDAVEERYRPLRGDSVPTTAIQSTEIERRAPAAASVLAHDPLDALAPGQLRSDGRIGAAENDDSAGRRGGKRYRGIRHRRDADGIFGAVGEKCGAGCSVPLGVDIHVERRDCVVGRGLVFRVGMQWMRGNP